MFVAIMRQPPMLMYHRRVTASPGSASYDVTTRFVKIKWRRGWDCSRPGTAARPPLRSGPALRCGSFRLPHLPPGSEFRRTDSIGGEIAFMQAYEFGFGQLGETLAAVRIDFFL